MSKFKTLIATILASVTLAGCARTYPPPRVLPPVADSVAFHKCSILAGIDLREAGVIGSDPKVAPYPNGTPDTWVVGLNAVEAGQPVLYVYTCYRRPNMNPNVIDERWYVLFQGHA